MKLGLFCMVRLVVHYSLTKKLPLLKKNWLYAKYSNKMNSFSKATMVTAGRAGLLSALTAGTLKSKDGSLVMLRECKVFHNHITFLPVLHSKALFHLLMIKWSGGQSRAGGRNNCSPQISSINKMTFF